MLRWGAVLTYFCGFEPRCTRERKVSVMPAATRRQVWGRGSREQVFRQLQLGAAAPSWPLFAWESFGMLFLWVARKTITSLSLCFALYKSISRELFLEDRWFWIVNQDNVGLRLKMSNTPLFALENTSLWTLFRQFRIHVSLLVYYLS